MKKVIGVFHGLQVVVRLIISTIYYRGMPPFLTDYHDFTDYALMTFVEVMIIKITL